MSIRTTSSLITPSRCEPCAQSFKFPESARPTAATVAVDEVSFEVNEGKSLVLIGPTARERPPRWSASKGCASPTGHHLGSGSRSLRQVYKLQDRIGVQLQQAQLQKRIKVWEAVDLWASLYRKKAIDGEHLLEQLGLTDKRDAWFMNPLRRPEAAAVYCPCADQRSGGGVSRRADHRAGSAVAAGDLGSGARHPRARQDRLP
jgi:ABC-type phosphate/phosphonate transport system ATPase subunit